MILEESVSRNETLMGSHKSLRETLWPQGGKWYQRCKKGTLLVVQLRLYASNAWGTGLIPGQGIKIPHATGHGKKKKKKRCKEGHNRCNC